MNVLFFPIPQRLLGVLRGAAILWLGLVMPAACAGARTISLANDQPEEMDERPPRLTPAPLLAPDGAAPFLEAQLRLASGDMTGALQRLEPLLKKGNCPPEAYEAVAEIHLAASAPEKAMEPLAQALKRWPGNTDLLMLRAQALRAQNKYEEAIAALEAGLKAEPARQEALEGLSNLRLQLLRQVTSEDDLDKQMVQLINIYERMLKGREGSDRVPPLLILSSLNLRRNQPYRAEPYAREAVDLGGRDARAYMALGGVLEAENKTSEALKTYTQALLTEPANSDVRDKINSMLGNEAKTNFYFSLSREYPGIKELQDTAAGLLMGADRWVDAESVLSAAAANWPDDSKARLALVRVWLAEGKLDRGVEEVRKMADRKDEFTSLVAMAVGEALAQKGENAKAYALIDELYQRDKNDEALAIGATALLAEREMRGQALGLIKEFSARHPESIKAIAQQCDLLSDAKRFDEAYALLDGLPGMMKRQHADEISETRAQLLQEQKRWSESLDILNALLKKHADNPQYQQAAGMACQQLGRLGEAEACYREALRLNPEDPEALNTLGYFLAETKQKLDEALTLTLKARRIAPSAGHIIDSVGWVYYQKGDFNRAIEQLREAARLSKQTPDAAEIYEHLGDACDKAGRRDDARKAWQKALELNKDLASVREKLNRLQ